MAEGWLLKRSGGRSDTPGQSQEEAPSRFSSVGEARRKWEHRYFVLLRGQLSYYQNPEQYQRGAPPQGQVQLRHASLWDYAREEPKLKGRVDKFIIVTPGRMFYLCAESLEDLDMWRTAIGLVIVKAMRTWSPTEVKTWVEINGMPRWAMAFYDQQVDGRRLRELQDPELLKSLVEDERDCATLASLLQQLTATVAATTSPRAEDAGRTTSADALARASGHDVFVLYADGQRQCAPPDCTRRAGTFIVRLAM